MSRDDCGSSPAAASRLPVSLSHTHTPWHTNPPIPLWVMGDVSEPDRYWVSLFQRQSGRPTLSRGRESLTMKMCSILTANINTDSFLLGPIPKSRMRLKWNLEYWLFFSGESAGELFSNSTKTPHVVTKLSWFWNDLMSPRSRRIYSYNHNQVHQVVVSAPPTVAFQPYKTTTLHIFVLFCYQFFINEYGSVQSGVRSYRHIIS